MGCGPGSRFFPRNAKTGWDLRSPRPSLCLPDCQNYRKLRRMPCQSVFPASRSDHPIFRMISQIFGDLAGTRSPRPRSGSRNPMGNSQVLLDQHAERSDRIPML